MNTREQRRYLGCGYEPPIDRVRLTLWQPPVGKVGYNGPDPTMCAGYTTNLPEVLETGVARMHWSKGNASVMADGDQPSEDLLNAIIVLEGEYNAMQHWMLTPSKDGGGGS
jgi:hypothetical protein